MLKLGDSVVWGKKGNYNEVTGSHWKSLEVLGSPPPPLPPMHTFTATETKGDSPSVFPFGL